MTITPAPIVAASEPLPERVYTLDEAAALLEKRLLYTVDEVAALLSLSRPSLYELMNSGRLRSVKVLRCRRIPAEALEDFLRGLADD